MKNYIPLYPPNIPKRSIYYLKKCVDENYVSTSGKLIKLFEEKISNYTKSKYVVALNSGTSALHLALKVVGVKKKDEVIVPTLTFVATINAVLYNNCSPIFMDCDDYYNIDCNKILDFLDNETIFKNNFTFNKKTKKRIYAIIVTHVWGNAANILKLTEICKKKNIKLIEDASESLGTYYRNNRKNHTGTIGDVGVLSFNANKIITTGCGGMLLTNKKKYYELTKYYSAQSKDDDVNFIHNNVGYNYRMTNISAALGIEQINNINKILIKKRKIKNLYKKYLNKNIINFFDGPEYAKNNNWMNIVQINTPKKISLKKIINLFEKKGIQLRPVWFLNHKQRPFKQFETYKIEKAKKLFKNSLCIPSSISLSFKDIKRVTNIFNSVK